MTQNWQVVHVFVSSSCLTYRMKESVTCSMTQVRGKSLRDLSFFYFNPHIKSKNTSKLDKSSQLKHFISEKKNQKKNQKAQPSCRSRFQPMCLRSDRVLPGHVWLQRQSRGRAGPEERRNCRGTEKGRLVCYVLFFFPFVDTFLMRLCSLKQDHKVLRGSHSSPVVAELSSRSSGQTGRVTLGKNVSDRDYEMIHVVVWKDLLHTWQSWEII